MIYVITVLKVLLVLRSATQALVCIDRDALEDMVKERRRKAALKQALIYCSKIKNKATMS